MRWVVALLLLGACDVVLGLDERPVPEPGESFENDEDHDDIVDAEDPCPHIANTSKSDRDKDNIGDDCDPRPDEKDRRYFFPLLDGNLGPLVAGGLLVSGDTQGDPGSVLLGGPVSERSTLAFDIDTNRADVMIEATILQADTSAELGIYAVHRAFEDTKTMRGDNCLVGRDAQLPPNFIEMNLDAEGPTEQRFSGNLGMAHGTLQLSRTATDLSCVFKGDLISTSIPDYPAPQRTELGDVVISTVRLRAQVFWVWVVVPRP